MNNVKPSSIILVIVVVVTGISLLAVMKNGIFVDVDYHIIPKVGGRELNPSIFVLCGCFVMTFLCLFLKRKNL